MNPTQDPSQPQPGVNNAPEPAITPNQPVYGQALNPVVSPFYPPIEQAPKKKSLLWLWIVLGVGAVLLLIAGVVVGIIVFLNSPDTNDSLTSNTSNTTSDQASSVDESSVFGLEYDISTVSDPAWAFPYTVDGWTMSVMDQDGMNQLKKDNSQSLFTSYQLLRDGLVALNDADGSQECLDTFFGSLKKQATVTSDERSSMMIPLFDGGSLEFAVSDYTYTVSGQQYTGKILARATDLHILSLMYGGLESAVSDSEWSTLTENVMISANYK